MTRIPKNHPQYRRRLAKELRIEAGKGNGFYAGAIRCTWAVTSGKDCTISCRKAGGGWIRPGDDGYRTVNGEEIVASTVVQ